jgi:hypothetical protein
MGNAKGGWGLVGFRPSSQGGSLPQRATFGIKYILELARCGRDPRGAAWGRMGPHGAAWGRMGLRVVALGRIGSHWVAIPYAIGTWGPAAG